MPAVGLAPLAANTFADITMTKLRCGKYDGKRILLYERRYSKQST